ncbi:potassium channel family protein [Dactylosporangium sp. NPDC051485]|uniref:potassium channel family protein n=1 Tax=Dactylosporangium sp. NPDC051485 TaxID=3154846 RepID=UPI003426DECD
MLLPVLVDAGLLALYLTAPLERPLSPGGLLATAAAIALVLSLVARELRAIPRAEHPRLRALGILAGSFPMLIVPFASVYVWLSHHGHFGAPLSHVAGLYFAMTVFTTTGFGDIVPRTDAAQLAVLVQMVLDLVYVGLFARLLAGAARRRPRP